MPYITSPNLDPKTRAWILEMIVYRLKSSLHRMDLDRWCGRTMENVRR